VFVENLPERDIVFNCDTAEEKISGIQELHGGKGWSLLSDYCLQADSVRLSQTDIQQEGFSKKGGLPPGIPDI